MSVVVVDDRGRVYLPSDIRSKLGINPGDRVKIIIKDNMIVLIPIKEGVKRVTRGKKWGSEAFLDAGEALVST